MIGCRPLTDSEIDQLKALADLDIRARCLLILGATTGFRISELLSLHVKDVLNQPRVTVLKRNRKGKARSHSVTLHPEAAEAITALVYAERLQGSDPLFKSRRSDKAIDRIRAHTLLKQAFKALGLKGKVATHSMRKYFAGAVYDALDKNIYETAKALGHKSIDSTAAYLSFKTEHVDKAILSLRRGPAK